MLNKNADVFNNGNKGNVNIRIYCKEEIYTCIRLKIIFSFHI